MYEDEGGFFILEKQEEVRAASTTYKSDAKDELTTLPIYQYYGYVMIHIMCVRMKQETNVI